MRITLEWLKEQGACTASTTRFAREYPDGVDLTPSNIRNAAPRYDLYWLALRILAPHKFDWFVEMTSDALREYGDALRGARRARENAIDSNREPRTLGIAWAAYEQTRQAATEEYRRALADALITTLGLCTSQESRP